MTASPRSVELASAAVVAAADKLASDLMILDVSDQLVITDCFVLASAPNDRQLLTFTSGAYFGITTVTATPSSRP